MPGIPLTGGGARDHHRAPAGVRRRSPTTGRSARRRRPLGGHRVHGVRRGPGAGATRSASRSLETRRARGAAHRRRPRGTRATPAGSSACSTRRPPRPGARPTPSAATCGSGAVTTAGEHLLPASARVVPCPPPGRRRSGSRSPRARGCGRCSPTTRSTSSSPAPAGRPPARGSARCGTTRSPSSARPGTADGFDPAAATWLLREHGSGIRTTLTGLLEDLPARPPQPDHGLARGDDRRGAGRARGDARGARGRGRDLLAEGALVELPMAGVAALAALARRHPPRRHGQHRTARRPPPRRRGAAGVAPGLNSGRGGTLRSTSRRSAASARVDRAGVPGPGLPAPARRGRGRRRTSAARGRPRRRIAARFAAAVAEDWPPERNATPARSSGTVARSTSTVARATSYGSTGWRPVAGVTMLGLSTIAGRVDAGVVERAARASRASGSCRRRTPSSRCSPVRRAPPARRSAPGRASWQMRA